MQMIKDILEIAIPTYNGSVTIEEAIRSLKPFMDRGVRVTVFDNASTDGTRDVVTLLMREFDSLGIVSAQINVGYDGNIRRCAEGGRSLYLWFFSDDDIAPDNCADILADELIRGVVVAYFNHYPFYDGAIRFRGGAKYGEAYERMDSGFRFLHKYDLGFISSLVVNRLLCFKYLDCMFDGSYQGTLELASRIVLGNHGSCVFFGNYSVGARTLLVPRYNSVRQGFVTKAELFKRIRGEGHLNEKEYSLLVRQLVGFYFLYIVIKDRAYGVTPTLALSQLLKNFRFRGRPWLFVFMARCCVRLPKFFSSIALGSYLRARRLLKHTAI